MTVKMSVDDHLHREKIKRLLKLTGKTEKEFVKEQGALLAQMLAKVTPPYAGGQLAFIKGAKYGSAKDKKQGEAAILSDMNIIFKQREQGYLEFLIQTTGTRRNIRQNLRTKSGQSYLVDVDFVNPDSLSEAIRFYKSMRRADGRVKGKQGGKQAHDTRIGRWQSRNVMWITPALFKKVYETIKGNVGIAKAAHAKIANRLGAKAKAPAWINRHFSQVSARVMVSQGSKGATVSFTASAAGLQHTIPKIRRATQIRSGLALKALERQHRADIKKSGFKSK